MHRGEVRWASLVGRAGAERRPVDKFTTKTILMVKKIILKIDLLVIMVFGGLVCAWDAQRPPAKPSDSIETRAVSFSLSWAGIIPGITKDQELVKKCGKGFWIENIGHSGGRAYLTSNRSIVLIAEIHGDLIDSITVESSSEASYEISHLEDVPIVKLLPNHASFGGIALDDRRDTVYKTLGPPAETGKFAAVEQLLTWGVKYSGAVDPVAEFSIVIAEGHVAAFILSNGD